MASMRHRTGFGGITRKIVFVLIALFCAVFFSSRWSGAADMDLIERIIQAYGGREALARVHGLRAEGEITAFMPEDRGTYVYVLKRSGKLLVDIRYSRGSEKRILNGGKGYSGTDASVTEAAGPAYDAMVYQYDQLDLPYGLLDNSLAATAVKSKREQEGNVYLLKLRDRSGKTIDIVVDAGTHRIVRTSGSIVMGGTQAVLSSEYRDFRKTGGIMLPYTIVNYADGFKISETRISTYRINPDVADAVFAP